MLCHLEEKFAVDGKADASKCKDPSGMTPIDKLRDLRVLRGNNSSIGNAKGEKNEKKHGSS